MIVRLVVATLAVQTTDVFNGNRATDAVFNFVVVAFVSFIVIVLFELHLTLAVTVDTPTHAEWGVLVNQFHFLYGAVTVLAL